METTHIRSHFLPASESGDVSSYEDSIDEVPYDLDLSDAEIRSRIVGRSHDLYEKLKGVGHEWSELMRRFGHWEVRQHGWWIWRKLVSDSVR